MIKIEIYFVLSKLCHFLDTKVFMIKRSNPVEETEITDTGLTLISQSGEFFLSIERRYCKKVVIETGISASSDTINQYTIL